MKIRNTICALLCATALAAAAIPAHAELSFTSTVARMMPNKDGTADISFAANPAGCTNSSSPKRFRMWISTTTGMTDEGFRAIYTTLLYAASTGKSVSVSYDEAWSSCYITRVQIIQ